MYEVGSWVIDTNIKEGVTIEKVINDCSSGNIYLVSKDDGDCYLVKEDRLVTCDKYYFNK